MLKRLCLTILIGLTPFAAAADANLARDWGQAAGALRTETALLMRHLDQGHELVLSDTYALNVFRFGRTSSDLAHWIDTSDGPKDLGCIFRGMSEEAETQLTEIEMAASGTAKRQALSRLTTLFADAEMIAAAARKRAPTPSLAAVPETSSCSADSALILETLH